MKSSIIKKDIIYDDSCPVCRTAVEKIRRKNKTGSFNYIPSSHNLPEKISHLIPSDMPDKTVIVISEGKVYTESEALSKILKELGGIYSVFGFFINFPIIKTVSNWLYRRISVNRHALSHYFHKNSETF